MFIHITAGSGGAGLACALLLYAVCFSSTAQAAEPTPYPVLPDFDVRRQTTLPQPSRPSPAIQAVARLHTRLPGAKVEWDDAFGTPVWITPQHGFLTGTNGVGRSVADEAARAVPASDPNRPIKTFLNDHSGIFGHDATALRSARLVRTHTNTSGTLRTAVWQQEVENIPVFGALLVGHTTLRGELVAISSRFVRAAVETAGQRPGLPAPPPQQRLSTAAAIACAAAQVTEQVVAAEISEVPRPNPGHHGYKTHRAPSLPGDVHTRLVWLPSARDQLTLCYETILTSRRLGEMFRVLIDARTGAALLRQNLTHYIEPATYVVFASDSPSPLSPGHSAPATNQPPLVARTPVTLSALSTNASPNGWINPGVNETRGNNVDAYLDRNEDNVPDGPRPQGAPYRVFDYPPNLELHPYSYGAAAVVQLFYWCNWMHDRLYELGFTEAAGNFQADNFGRGGFGNDALNAEAQNGGTTNNSRFFTTPDGIPPRMEMYLFNGTTPMRDGSLDAEVILHEYTHGLTSRLIGGGTEPSALQTRGMAEGWSDFYALALLSEPGDDLGGTYPIGAYVALLEPGFQENYYFGTRRYPYSTTLSRDPLTFQDIDPTKASNHVGVPRNPLTTNSPAYAPDAPYSIGELWCTLLWELRANLIARYGFTQGNQLAMQLVTDALALTPAESTLLQGRTALILADRASHGGIHFYDIWTAFAKRGLGQSAEGPPSWTTTGVQEGFDVPDTMQVAPGTGLVFAGPIGGAFSPAAGSYVLTNIWTNVVTWSAYASASWLEILPQSGTLLPAGSGATVTVSVNAAANALPAGVHTNLVCFTNHATGVCTPISFILRIGQPDFLTELFTSQDNDLAGHTFTFTPDGSASYYAVCREAAAEFPTDPAGGTPLLLLTDDSSAPINLGSGPPVSLYGASATELFVGSNGYITFGSGDRERVPSLTNHFNRLRISALFDDLDPGAGATVSWKQVGDRVAITFLGVPEYNSTNRNSFQIELFHDGRLRLTYLEVNSHDGLVGLSRGGGVPPAFFESDFSAYGGCAEPLVLIVPSLATEGDGLLTGLGAVQIPLPLATNLPVQLASEVPTEVTTQPEVVIPAGLTNAQFDLTVLDDPLLDGTTLVPVTAAANGFLRATNYLAVFDNEFATLSLRMPTNAMEGLGSVLGTVVASAAPAVDVRVQLTTGYTDEIRVPDYVLIPAGKTSAVFTVTIIDDDLIDGPQSPTVTAHVENWVDGIAAIPVADNDATVLTVGLPAGANESDGLLPGAGTLRLFGRLPTNLVVTIASSRPDLLTVPPTATIPAGRKSMAFDVTTVDNGLINSPQTVVITATANGFTPGNTNISLADDETPPTPLNPSPAHLAAQVPAQTDLYWEIARRELLVNGGFETGNFTGWTRENSGPGNSSINDGKLDPPSVDGPLPPLSGGYSMVTTQSGPSWRSLYQDFTIPGGAGSVRLRWFHRLRNHAGAYAANQHFRVEIRDPTNNVLAVAYTTTTSEPLYSEWIQHLYDLTPFRGQNVRLAFVQEDQLGYFNVHLDDVSVSIGPSPGTEYDVYFGTTPTPGLSELRGTTTILQWLLPDLAPLTTYYWQVIARRVGATSSPVWQFTTRGVDHFEWSQVPSPQQQNRPFSVTITARDEAGKAVTNFVGPVMLAGEMDAPEREISGSAVAARDPLGAGSDDSRCQVIYLASELGGAQRFNGLALQVGIAPGQPLNRWTLRLKHTQLSSYATPLWQEEGWTVAYQNNESINDEAWVYFPFTTPFDYNGVDNLMIDFSFNNSTKSSDGMCIAFLADPPRVVHAGSDSLFGDPLNWSGSTPTPMLTNRVPIIRLQPAPLAVPIAPLASGPFIDGTWTGWVTVLEPAATLTLSASDVGGHNGRSQSFLVQPGVEVRIVDWQWIGADFRIGFRSVAGTTYRVDAATTLTPPADWTPIGDLLPGTGETLYVTDVDAAAHPARFYQIVVLP